MPTIREGLEELGRLCAQLRADLIRELRLEQLADWITDRLRRGR